MQKFKLCVYSKLITSPRHKAINITFKILNRLPRVNYQIIRSVYIIAGIGSKVQPSVKNRILISKNISCVNLRKRNCGPISELS